jgi:hypothetical protein
MFSKPVGTVLLALGCLTAAAGGAYVATRHNQSDAATVAARPVEPAPAAGAATPSQPVAETEATVTSPKAEAEPVKAEAPAPAPARRPETPRKDIREATPARSPARPADVARNDTAAKTPAQRTVPMNGANTPAPAADPIQVPQAASPAPVTTPPARPAEAMRPADPPQPEPVRVPQYDELILPASSVIGLQVETSTNTERARVEDRVDARVSRDVMAGGRVAIPAGSRVIGSVTLVERGGKV